MRMRPAVSLLRVGVHPISVMLIFGALCGLFVFALHPWFMNWGSTPEERATVLPGDTAPPETYFTRAITIDAPPSAVWPWLLAIGQDRAGFLSNDYLENLAGGDIHNAATLRPEWQQRALGDRVPMSGEAERRLAGDYTLLTVRILEPQQVIGDIPGRFVLRPVRAVSADRLGGRPGTPAGGRQLCRVRPDVPPARGGHCRQRPRSDHRTAPLGPAAAARCPSS